MKQPVSVRLYYDGAWQTVTGNTFTRSPIRIKYKQGETCSLSLTFDNRDGSKDPSNATSPLWGKVGRNTPIRVELNPTDTSGALANVTDSFTRSVSNGWGSANTGQAWSINGAGGSLLTSNWDVTGTVGRMFVPVDNAYRYSKLDSLSIVDGRFELTFDTSISNVTGAAIEPGNILIRENDGQQILFRTEISAAEVVTVRIFQTDHDGDTQLASAVVSRFVWAGQPIRVIAEAIGSTVRMKVYDPAGTVPADDVWDATSDAATVLEPGTVSVRNGVAVGNTNTKPVEFRTDDFAITVVDPRFTGEVAEWIPRRDLKNNADAWTDVTANGILRRLGQGENNLGSALRRHIAATSPLAYWPLEPTTRFANEVAGGAPMVSSGAEVEFGAFTGAPGMDKGPKLIVQTDRSPVNQIAGDIPGTSTDWTVSLWMRAEPGSDSGIFSTPIVDFAEFETTGGTAVYWTLEALSNPGASQLEVTAYALDASRTLITVPGTIAPRVNVETLDGEWHMVTLRVQQDGGTLRAFLTVDDLTSSVGTDTDGTWTNGRLVRAHLPKRVDAANVTDLSMGHLVAWDGAASSTYASAAEVEDRHDAGMGWPGELAGRRFLRLCAEEGITAAVIGDPDDTQPMGPQYVDSFTNHMAEIAATDDGVVIEPRCAVALQYRTGRSRYNPDAAITIDHANKEIGPPLEPIIGDKGIRNEVTAARREGGSYTVALESGPLSVLAPPDGVGRYKESLSVNPADDAALPSLAMWRMHKTTVDERYYRRIGLDLDAHPEMATTASLLDLAERVDVVNLYPDDDRQIITAYEETIGNNRRTIILETLPESPYRVGVLDSIRLASGESTLAADFDAGTDTSMSVASSGTLWTGANVPFNISVDGVVLTVTAVVGAASPQTFTITQAPVNGVEKTITAGVEVDITDKVYLGL